MRPLLSLSLSTSAGDGNSWKCWAVETSSLLRYYVDSQIVTDISKCRGTSIMTFELSKSRLESLNLKMKSPWIYVDVEIYEVTGVLKDSSEQMLVSVYHSTKRNISTDFNLQQHTSKIFQTQKDLNLQQHTSDIFLHINRLKSSVAHL